MELAPIADLACEKTGPDALLGFHVDVHANDHLLVSIRREMPIGYAGV